MFLFDFGDVRRKKWDRGYLTKVKRVFPFFARTPEREKNSLKVEGKK